ncbi:hypothetical protein A3C87_02110 [Candidatus Kaiserbacteria bacterium RIFCSPHIGHO2_02_FULL_49_34]|uniref:Leucine-binding protein domain-containing protein n=1 Tax=Candidatus Kaiserbacteria bacterium RIFCSPHIGHO2_02_FULL_49_34 TaxID=1798491 RepID=A0A1F6DKY9_9BACT|nr:MAG: hypothetical protein A3C87_02110 [Candidatus Kaiserbacteria bacterium RIFCSPHIGHO2_02_FULL_49_34]
MFFKLFLRYRIITIGTLFVVSGAVVALYIMKKPPELIIAAPISIHTELGKTLEFAMRLALTEYGEQHNDFKITFVPIDVTSFEDAGNYDDLERFDSFVRVVTDPRTVAVLGPVTTAATMRMLPILSTAGILQINYAATYPGFVVPDFGGPTEYRSFFPTEDRTYFSLIPHMQQIADVMSERLAAEKYTDIYIVSDGSAYGTTGADSVKASVSQHGGTIVGNEVLSLSTIDTLIASIKEAHPSCVAAISYPSEVFRNFIDALVATGASDCLSGTHLENTYQALYGADLPRIRALSFNPSPTISVKTNEHTRKISEHYEREYGETLNLTAAAYRAYDAMRFALAAIDVSDGTRKDVLHAAKNMKTFKTIAGNVRFDTYGAAYPVVVEVVDIRDGKIFRRD